MTFAHVGTTQSWDTGSSHSFTPNGVGHLVVLVEITKLAQSPMITGLSASNVTWTRLTPDFLTSVAATATAAAIWIGTTTSTSPANTTITWAGGSEPAHWEAEVNEFSSTVGSWALDVYGGIDSNSNVTYPSLTPAGAGELYVGMHYDDSGAAAGSTSGYTYHVTSHGNGALYNAACTSSTQAPTWAGTVVMGGIAALIKESSPDSGTAAVTLKKMTVAGAGCAAALYGSYAFDEGSGTTIVDYSGNSHNMTIVGTNSWVTGQGSYAKAFQSGATTSDGAYYDHGSDDSVLSGDVVVMLWYKHTGGSSTTICHAGGLYSAAATARLAIYSYRSRSSIASSPHLTVRDSAGTISDVGANGTNADTNWHHATAVYHANGLIEEYLDGVLAASSTPTANPIGNNCRYIGVGDFLSALSATEAQVQDMRVFSGALNAAKINDYMNTPVHSITPTGTAAVTLKKMTVSGTATAPLVGTVAVTLKKMSVSGSQSSGYALVALGSVSQSMSPSFGQPTVAGSLLIAWLGSNSSASTDPFSTSSPGWTLLPAWGSAFDWATIAYKENCGAAETAPIFNGNGPSEPLSMLGEFSGGRISSSLEQTAAGSGAPDLVAQCASPDSQPGNLMIGIGYFNSPTIAATVTGTMTDSNGSSVTVGGSNGQPGGAGTVAYDFAWGVAGSTLGASGDRYEALVNAFSGGGGGLATFKPASSSSSVTGTGAVTLKKMTVAATATIFDEGTSAAVLKKMLIAGTATAPVAGTGVPVLKKMTTFGQGKAKVSGTIVVSTRKMSVSGSGLAPIFGTVDVVLPKMQIRAGLQKDSPLFIFSQF